MVAVPESAYVRDMFNAFLTVAEHFCRLIQPQAKMFFLWRSSGVCPEQAKQRGLGNVALARELLIPETGDHVLFHDSLRFPNAGVGAVGTSARGEGGGVGRSSVRGTHGPEQRLVPPPAGHARDLAVRARNAWAGSSHSRWP